MGRQSGAKLFVIEVGVQIGEDRAPWRDPLDPCQRLADREMSRMRRVAQRIDDPQIEPRERRNALRREVTHIARISCRAEPEAKRGNVAMILQERQRSDSAAGAFDRDRFAGAQPVLVKNWRIGAAWRLDETVLESRVDDLTGRLVEIDVDTAA